MSDSLRILALEEPPEAPDAIAPSRDWIRRRAPWLVAAAVLAVLGLVGAQTMLDARERARLAYLADVPGVLQPIPQHPSAIWRWTATSAATLVAGDTADRWAIGVRYGQGSVDLRGTDPDTGAVAWTTAFPIDDALPADERGSFPSVWVRCVTAAAAPAARAVCGADLAGPARVVGTPLMVLDPTDGRVLARQVLPAGTLWAVSDGRLVIARPVADDDTHTHWDVRATDPTTGALAWHHDTPSVELTEPVQVGATSIDTEARLTSDDARVLLTGGGHAWLWSPAGAPQADDRVGTDGWAELGRSGTLVWTPFQSLAVPAGELITTRGEHRGVTGVQASLAVDDGSAPGVVLLRSGAGGTTLVAHDATSGRELWSADGNTGQVLVLDGAVVAAGSSSVVARDARSGHERWHAGLDAAPTYLGADPDHVVVLTDDDQLRALDLADGRTATTADVGAMLGSAADLDGAHEFGGRLFVTFRDGSGLAVG